MFLFGCDNKYQESKDADVTSRWLIITDIYNSGNVDRALGLSKTFVADYPENPFSHWALGGMLIAFSQQSEIEKKQSEKYVENGLEEFKKALSMWLLQGETEVFKMGIVYAVALHEYERTDEALEAFFLYYEKNKEKVAVDPEFLYFVIEYADALAKKERFSDAINKYIYSFKINGSDPVLIKGYVKLQSDYIDLDEAIFIADSFERKSGFNSGVVFEKCRAFYTHNYIKEATSCFNKLILAIEISDLFYEPSKQYLSELKQGH